MKITLKKKIAAAAAAVTIVGGSGIALAYWTSTGNGAGEATAGTSSDWVVATDAATGGLLTPGGPTDSVPFHVTNTNTGHQGLESVTVSVGDADPETGAKVTWASGTCDDDDFAIGHVDAAADAGAVSAAGAAHVITYSTVVDLAGDPPGVGTGGTHTGTITIQMINKPAESQDDCKGVTVPLYLAAS